MILLRTFWATRYVLVHTSSVLYVPVRYIPYSALGICNTPYLIFTSPLVSFSIKRVCFQTFDCRPFFMKTIRNTKENTKIPGNLGLPENLNVTGHKLSKKQNFCDKTFSLNLRKFGKV